MEGLTGYWIKAIVLYVPTFLPVTAGTSLELTEEGDYRLHCKENESIYATVAVAAPSADEITRYRPLLYSHASIMGVVFGILLPLGAFLAHHRVLLVHRVLQPIGIVLALVGLVLVVVYVELSERKHFGKLVHAVTGLGLLISAVVVTPSLILLPSVKALQFGGRLRFERAWHKRSGQIVVFFGIGNVLVVREGGGAGEYFRIL